MIKGKGFTLIELMVSIALGLLIVAAGLSIYLSSQRSMNLQNGMGELQQNVIFGMSSLVRDLQHVNLNTTATQRISYNTSGSGIIFSKDNLPSGFTISSAYVTKQDITVSGTNPNKSDQLTVQFIPRYQETRTVTSGKTDTTTITSTANMLNCEGARISSSVSSTNADTLTAAKPVIVQRYYVGEMKKTSGQSFSPKRYALYCDAGYYKTGDVTITGFGDNAQQVIPNIDTFRFKFGVVDSNDNLRYASVDPYKNDLSTSNIVSVNIGILAHSNNPVGASNINNDQSFSLFGDDVKGASNNEQLQYGVVTLGAEQKTGSKFIREGFSQVVAFRNALGGE